MNEQNKRQIQYNVARQALISASLNLFVHKGYAGTKIHDITDAAHVSPGLLFHYFSSKEEILQELMNKVKDEFDGIATLLQSNDDPQEILTTIASTILGSFSDDESKYMFLLVNQVLTLSDLPSTIQSVGAHSQSVELSVRIIRAGQQSGIFRTGDPLSLSVAFWGALQGIAEMLVWKPGTTVPATDAVMGILLRGSF